MNGETFEGLSDAETQTLSSYYADVPAASVFSEEVLENDEIEYIDALAAQYYDALESNGQIEALAGMSADEMDELFDSVELPEALNVSRAASYYEPADYSAVIKTLGYSYTLEQIARQLVALGSTINLGAAFPFIELVAIVAGAFIVTLSIAVLYCAAAIAANELVCGWYLYNTSQVKEANEMAAAIVATNREEITAPDVFCVMQNDAAMLVQKVGETYAAMGFSTVPSPVQVHQRDKYPLNMQHIHAMLISGKQGHTHIFFAVPYIM